MTAIVRTAASAMLILALASAPALAQDASASSASQGEQETGTAAAAKRADAADPTRLIDPNRAASAILVRTTRDFNEIRIVPVGRSGNSEALVRALLDHDAGVEDLHDAIRGNRAMMKVLKAHAVSVSDVVAVTTDRNNNAIIFTRR